MADKRRAEQNHRWLRDLRRQVAMIQEAVVIESVNCDRDRPEVDWALIEEKLAAAMATIKYASSTDAEQQQRKSA